MHHCIAAASLLILFHGTALTAQGAQRFVHPQGDDARDGSSPGQALGSIQTALERSGPGDEVLLLPGAYSEDVRTVRSGRVDAPITLRGLGEVVLHGEGGTSILNIRHSHFHVRDLTLDGAHGERLGYRNKLIYAQGGDRSLLSGLSLTHLHLSDAGGECLRLRFVRNSQVAFNRISGCGRLDFDLPQGKKNGEGIYLGTAPEQLDGGRDGSHGNRIHDNVIHTQGNECVDVKEGAEYNRIDHNVCSGQLDPDSAGISIRGNHNLVHHNLVYSNRGSGIRLGGDTSTDGIHNEVYGNLLEANQEGALKVMRLPQQRLCPNRIVQPEGWPVVRWGAERADPALVGCQD